MQSFSMLSICVHPCFSVFPFAVFLLSCSTVLSGYCNVSIYVLVILGVMKLIHHSEASGKFKLRKHGPGKNLLTQTDHIISIHQPFGRIFKTCLFPGLFSASGTSRKNLTSINNVKFSYSLYVLPQPIIDIFSPAPSPTGALFL